MQQSLCFTNWFCRESEVFPKGSQSFMIRKNLFLTLISQVENWILFNKICQNKSNTVRYDLFSNSQSKISEMWQNNLIRKRFFACVKHDIKKWIFFFEWLALLILSLVKYKSLISECLHQSFSTMLARMQKDFFAEIVVAWSHCENSF